MRLRVGTVSLVLFCSIAAAPASAVVCLDNSMTIDEIVDAINKTPSCERAMNLFKDCSVSTGGDTTLGDAVERKCERDFLSGLNPSSKAAYQRALGACDRKYRNESGTMYRSFTAFCRAEIAQRYSRQALKKKP